MAKNDLQTARESHDADVLARLARDDKRKHVQRAVAGNPNAPWSVLRGLLASHPREVLSNPSLPLLLLADPGMFNDLTAGALRGLSSERLLLGQILGWTQEPPWTELQATLVCIAHVRDRLPFGDGYKAPLHSIRVYLVERSMLPDDVEIHLVDDSSDAVRKALARSSKAAQVIESLLDMGESHENLAENVHLPTCYQWALAKHGSGYVRRLLARNPGLSEAVLAKLAGDTDAYVRRAVAIASRTPVSAWRRLLWDPSPEVQAAARRAKRTGVAT